MRGFLTTKSLMQTGMSVADGDFVGFRLEPHAVKIAILAT